MGTDVDVQRDPMEDFRHRVKEKLKADIGEMMPDAALNELVRRAVDETFFQPRVVKDSYGRIESSKPGWFVEEVTKVASPMLAAAVNKYVNDNEETIKKAIVEFTTQQNLMLLTIAAMRSGMLQDISTIADEVVARMKRNY